MTYDEVAGLVRASNKSGLDDTIIVALIYKESRFDQYAKSSAPNSSATGLMQVTRTALGEVNRVKRTQYNYGTMTIAANNVEVGSLYLSICVDRRRTTDAALDYYGTGAGYSTSIIRAAARLKDAADPRSVLIAEIGR